MKKQHFLSLLFCVFGCLFAQAAGITNPVTPQADSCDVVAFKNGRILRTKVLSVSKTAIKFRDCSDANAAEMSHDVSDVLSILYSNGSTADFSDNTANSNTSSSSPRVNSAQGNNTANTAKSGAAIFGILALLACFLGIFVAAIPLGICAIILGAIGISKAKKNMDRTGNTLGVLGVVFGAIILLLGLVGAASKI
jgi:hypothetical protein